MNKAEFADATKNTDAFHDVTIRQVAKGYIIVGRSRYMSKENGAQVVGIECETIAINALEAGALVSGYLSTGQFDEAPAPSKRTR